MSEYAPCADCAELCGNRFHPDGPWHRAEPIAASWEWAKIVVHWWRRNHWGCNCPETGMRAQPIRRY